MAQGVALDHRAGRPRSVRITACSLCCAVTTVGCSAPRTPLWQTRGAVWKRPMSEAAWKAEKERIAQRNEETRKAGKKEREAQERERAERKRVAAAARDEAGRASRKR